MSVAIILIHIVCRVFNSLFSLKIKLKIFYYVYHTAYYYSKEQCEEVQGSTSFTNWIKIATQEGTHIPGFILQYTSMI